MTLSVASHNRLSRHRNDAEFPRRRRDDAGNSHDGAKQMQVAPADLTEPIKRSRCEPPSRRDYALALCRAAHVRARLAQVEIETIATALKGNIISPDVALQWLGDAELAYDPMYDAPAVMISDEPTMETAS